MNIRQTQRNDGRHPETGLQRAAPRTASIRHVAKVDIREPCAELREDGETSPRGGPLYVRRTNGGVEIHFKRRAPAAWYERQRILRTQLAIVSGSKYKIEGRGHLRDVGNVINGQRAISRDDGSSPSRFGEKGVR